MGKDHHKEEIGLCPICKFFAELEKISKEKSKFFEHLNQSRIEFLKAIKSLVDERIESLEKKGARKAGKKMTKIQVE
ncbi:MAG: hypothetical protein V1930_07270 [Pseudomonadota bacterium]